MPPTRMMTIRLLPLATALACSPAAAEDRLALGLALASLGADYRTEAQDTLIPLLHLEFGNVFLDQDKGGVYFLGDEQDEHYWALGVVGQLRLQGYRSSHGPQLAGMQARKSTLELGPAVSIGGPWGSVSLQATEDILGQHRGSASGIQYAYEWGHQRWWLLPYVGFERLNAQAATYYYGVTPAEANPQRPAYRLRDARQWALGYELEYRLAPHWQLYHSLSYTSLDGDARKSPLVRHAEYASLTLGVTHDF